MDIPLPPGGYDIAVVLNYYKPYVSGLTTTAEAIAESLAARGHRVAVVAARHERSLPAFERRNGVDVLRAPVLARVSRGPVSPGFPFTAARVARRSRVVNLHVPMLEAGLVARLLRGAAPLVTTYHADIPTDGGPVEALAARAVASSARAAIRRSAGVVVNSEAAARQSRLRDAFRGSATTAIPAPCHDRSGGRPRYRRTRGLHVGYAGRIHAEKGIEYLITAFRAIPDPEARLLLAGDHLNVAGGSSIERVRRAAGEDPRIVFLGLLSGDELKDFYASIDVLSLPSVTESFGIVQVEGMMAGVPAVTTDSPGGRVPIAATGFGTLVPPRDPEAIAAALTALGALPPAERRAGAERARRRFGLGACIDAYEELFARLGGGRAEVLGPEVWSGASATMEE
ncbi:glycosyltransferase family 4 protein [Streptomyces sp. 8L]|uniref:glycosyltransferase family 4 protein n=1 Tax=Streptomyces sp. 8L TaxID=2877242 RepID=UPI001CD37EF4|nr:glycosyltransferase family 4 protein [Streptomyces sp. 8L]MCA1222589.1 glycosyltransferase family 4 protein [Streptomyces sp. 8L]